MVSKTASSLSIVGGTDLQGSTSLPETATRDNYTLQQNLHNAYEILQKEGDEDLVKQYLALLQKIVPTQDYYEERVKAKPEEEKNSTASPIGNVYEGSVDNMTNDTKTNDKAGNAARSIEGIANGFNLMIAFFALFIAIISVLSYLQITATQSIRDETVAKANSILVETKASNDKVLNEVQGLRGDMQNLKNEINQKFEIQDIKTENKLLKDKLDKK